MKGEMEIPAWELCKGCCFLAYCDNIDPFCNYPLQRRDGSDDDWDGCNQPEDVVFRGASCLSAYPNGAVITITAKPSVEIGFIPKEQTVDPKTGATTFTDIELLEVSEAKPK